MLSWLYIGNKKGFDILSLFQNPAQAIQAGMISQILGNMEPHKTAAELPATFPVSSGLQHRAKESLLPASDTPVFEDNQQVYT